MENMVSDKILKNYVFNSEILVLFHKQLFKKNHYCLYHEV